MAALLWLVSAVATLTSAPPADGPSIHILNDKSERPCAFEAVGLLAEQLARLAKLDDSHERFSQVFAVYVINDAQDAELPAVAGSYSVEASSLRFTPRFSLRAGMGYRAVLKPDELHKKTKSGSAAPQRPTTAITVDVAIPASKPGKPTEVTQIYPTAGVLPENQLKFYIYFSGPMGRGDAYQHVRILDARGKAAELPFLEIGEELWDASGRRLTLLIDPGRIKQGLKPREDLGPVLEAGRSYTLHIDRAWRDASGRAIKADFEKRFRTGPAVTGAIDLAEWNIQPPAAGSQAPLIIKSPRPLDHALWSRTVLVADAKGIELAGNVSIDDDERRWEFIPQNSWIAGKHQLVIDTTLEDLAGNRIGQPFEVEQLGTAQVIERPETVRIPFAVAPADGG